MSVSSPGHAVSCGNVVNTLCTYWLQNVLSWCEQFRFRLAFRLVSVVLSIPKLTDTMDMGIYHLIAVCMEYGQVHITLLLSNQYREFTPNQCYPPVAFIVIFLPGPFLLSYLVFIFIFSLFFVSVPCSRLSWPYCQPLSACQSTVSYRMAMCCLRCGSDMSFIEWW